VAGVRRRAAGGALAKTSGFVWVACVSYWPTGPAIVNGSSGMIVSIVWEIACAEFSFATEHFAVKEIEFSWRAFPMFGPLRSTCSTSWRVVGAVGGGLLSLAWCGLAVLDDTADDHRRGPVEPEHRAECLHRYAPATSPPPPLPTW
jgi:hypothetical protein